MENTRAWVLVIGVLLILALTAFGIVWSINSIVQTTVSPVQSMTGDLGTRVAQVLNPTPTILPDPVTIVREVRGLARLETIEYNLEKVVTAETGPGVFDQQHPGNRGRGDTLRQYQRYGGLVQFHIRVRGCGDLAQ